MKKKNNTSVKIFDFIKKNKLVKPVEILNQGFVGEPMLYRHLKKMLDDNLIKKRGKAPKTFYEINKEENIFQIKKDNGRLDVVSGSYLILEKEFYFIDSVGKEFLGSKAFVLWCQKRGFDVKEKSEEYFKIYQKYQKIRKNNLFDATSKVKKTFGKKCCIEKLFYFDFYSVEIFGKTKMGQKILYAKNSGDRKTIKEISDKVKQTVENLIKREKIDSVVFVPPTVPRQIQFMKILEENLNLNIAKIKVEKFVSDVRVPQKTLKKLEDRIDNANGTFMVNDNSVFKKTLIIDDAVGSGASINQIACKLKNNKNTKKVVGFSIVGSLNDFEVISEI